MNILKCSYYISLMGSSSLFGVNYFFTGNVPSDLSSDPVIFTKDSDQIINYNVSTHNLIVWYNLGSNSSDDTTYDNTNLLADYVDGPWNDISPSEGNNAFVSLNSTLGELPDDWISVGGKAVSLNSDITAERYMTLWGTSAALRIGNGVNSVEVSFDTMYLFNDYDSVLSVSEKATLNVGRLEMDGRNHASDASSNPHMLFHVSGTANIGTLELRSTDLSGVPTESMVHIESTGELTVATLNYESDDSKTAVIMLDHQGILKITNLSETLADEIEAYRDAGGIFSNSGHAVNVFEYEDELYVTTLEASAVPEPSHLSFVMGLFALLYLPLSARKVAI